MNRAVLRSRMNGMSRMNRMSAGGANAASQQIFGTTP